MRHVARGIAVAALVLAAGCEKVTLDNYEQLEVGMSREQVTDILGAPTACETVLQMKSCRWESGEQAIHVQFVGDEIVFFTSTGLR